MLSDLHPILQHPWKLKEDLSLSKEAQVVYRDLAPVPDSVSSLWSLHSFLPLSSLRLLIDDKILASEPLFAHCPCTGT